MRLKRGRSASFLTSVCATPSVSSPASPSSAPSPCCSRPARSARSVSLKVVTNKAERRAGTWNGPCGRCAHGTRRSNVASRRPRKGLRALETWCVFSLKLLLSPL
eukprot:5369647-Pyramimonas_sp.AAC.1